MDETVTRSARPCAAVLLAAALLGAGAAQAQAQPQLQPKAPVQAQVLRDPTRPPAMAGLAAGAAAAPDSAPQLQSVLVARGGRHVAVIDGQSVRVGDSFRGARVTRIGDEQVELTRGRERQVLRLHAPGQPGDPGAAPRAATQTDRD